MILGRREGLRSRIRCRMRRMAGFGGAGAASDEQERASATGFNAGWADDIPTGFQRVASEAEVEPGQLLEVFVDGQAIALANVGGQLHAIENTCPHAGGPLGDGALNGNSAVCPYHGWAFDVRTGVCDLNDTVSVKVFEVQSQNGQVCVKL